MSENTIHVKLKRVDPNGIPFTHGSDEAAGYDIYAIDYTTILPGTTARIRTGIATEIPPGYFGAVYARSGLATKQGLRPANCVAVVDSDYRGEWVLPIYNDSPEAHVIMPGDRVAQVVFQRCPTVEFKLVEELSESNRAAGGFGSTGR